MLINVIKYEFKNRYKTLSLMTIIFAIFTCLLSGAWYVKNKTSFCENEAVRFFWVIFSIGCVFVLIASIVCMIFQSSAGFYKRFYRNEGYLTNTLPVSSLTLHMGKFIADLIQIAYAYGLAVIAIPVILQDIKIYSKMIDVLTIAFGQIDNAALNSVSDIKGFLIIFFVATYIQTLLMVSNIDLAITIGRNFFTKNNDLLSVVFYFVIKAVDAIPSSIVSMLLAMKQLSSDYEDVSFGFMIQNMIISVLLCAAYVVVAKILTILIHKKRLNLY